MKKHANKTKHTYRNQIKKSKKSKQSKQSKQSKRATNKPTRNSKTIKNTALSKKQRALKQLKCAIKTHILNIIRAHKTKRKYAILAGGHAGGQNSHNAIVGGGKYGADTMVKNINTFFKWLYTMIASMFTGFNNKSRKNSSSNNNTETPSDLVKVSNAITNALKNPDVTHLDMLSQAKQAKEELQKEVGALGTNDPGNNDTQYHDALDTNHIAEPKK